MYIRDLNCISPQQHFGSTLSEGPATPHEGNKYLAFEPDYTSLIPRNMLRRMGKALRMGIGAGLPLLNKHADIGGILFGTADGGIEDSMEFLDQLVQYKESTLTPTHFVQSTPNSLAGQLAVMGNRTGYNATHVNKGLSFESALLDAWLVLREKEAETLLVGNIEQFSEHNYNIEYQAGAFKEKPVSSGALIGSGTPGTVNGEGCAMFVITAEPNEALCEVCDLDTFSYTYGLEVEERLLRFLNKNKLQPSDLDGLVMGFSGDSRTDYQYEQLINRLFPEQSVYTYKNLVGDYPTVSAFALWLSVQILQGRSLPAEAIYRSGSRTQNRMLIYNQYKGLQHSFILLQR